MKGFRETRWRLAAGGLVAAAALASPACFGVGVDSYDEFRSAVDAGASCRELYDMRGNFDDARDRTRIDRDLADIGCDSPASQREDV